MEKLSMTLMVGGLLVMVGYACYLLVSQFLVNAPTPIKIGIIMVLCGVIVGIFKLVVDRVKGGDDEDVNRKY